MLRAEPAPMGARAPTGLHARAWPGALDQETYGTPGGGSWLRVVISTIDDVPIATASRWRRSPLGRALGAGLHDLFVELGAQAVGVGECWCSAWWSIASRRWLVGTADALPALPGHRGSEELLERTVDRTRSPCTGRSPCRTPTTMTAGSSYGGACWPS